MIANNTFFKTSKMTLQSEFKRQNTAINTSTTKIRWEERKKERNEERKERRGELGRGDEGGVRAGR